MNWQPIQRVVVDEFGHIFERTVTVDAQRKDVVFRLFDSNVYETFDGSFGSKRTIGQNIEQFTKKQLTKLVVLTSETGSSRFC